MNRPCAAGAALLALTVTLIAGEASRHEAVVKETIASLDKISTTLGTVQDEDSAKAAQPELKKAAADWRGVRKKAEALPPPERGEKDRLAKEYKDKMDAAVKKLFGEVLRVQKVPGGKAALREIASVLDAPGQ